MAKLTNLKKQSKSCWAIFSVERNNSLAEFWKELFGCLVFWILNCWHVCKWTDTNRSLEIAVNCTAIWIAEKFWTFWARRIWAATLLHSVADFCISGFFGTLPPSLTFSFESCVDLLGNVHAADNRTYFPALIFFVSTVFWLSADLSQVKVTTIKIEFHDQTTLSVWKLFTRVLRCSLYCCLQKRTSFFEKCIKVQQTWFRGVLGSTVGLIMF